MGINLSMDGGARSLMDSLEQSKLVKNKLEDW